MSGLPFGLGGGAAAVVVAVVRRRSRGGVGRKSNGRRWKDHQSFSHYFLANRFFVCFFF